MPDSSIILEVFPFIRLLFEFIPAIERLLAFFIADVFKI